MCGVSPRNKRIATLVLMKARAAHRLLRLHLHGRRRWSLCRIIRSLLFAVSVAVGHLVRALACRASMHPRAFSAWLPCMQDASATQRD